MTEKKSMSDIWKAMEKQHGSEGLYAGNSSMTTYSEAISTGSLALDDALGIWGIPKGHIVQFAGYESSGKTLMSLLTIAEWQKKGPENWALFIDAEYSYDQKWAESLGVDNSRVMVYRENKAKLIFDRLTGIPSKPDKNGQIKKTKQGILDLEIESGGTGLGVIVLDSIAAMQPPAEEASAAGKDNMALIARFLPPALRKLTPMLTQTGICFIAINQVRFKIGVMYGDPIMSPGGQALHHAESQAIIFAAVNSKDRSIFDRNKEQIGHTIRAKVKKNKKAPSFKEAEFVVEYCKGIVSRHEELRDLGAKYGVIQRPNNKTWVLDGISYNGKDAMADALKNIELQNSVLDRVKEAKKSGVFIESDENEEKDVGQEIASDSLENDWQ